MNWYTVFLIDEPTSGDPAFAVLKIRTKDIESAAREAVCSYISNNGVNKSQVQVLYIVDAVSSIVYDNQGDAIC